MATYNIPITIPDGTAGQILAEIETAIGRARDPDTGTPIQTHLEYISDLCRWYLISLARKGRKTEHKQGYDAGYIDVSPGDITTG